MKNTRAPAAQGALLGVLVDANGNSVGSAFPVKMSLAVDGHSENENSVSVVADRRATVTSMEMHRDNNLLATIALNNAANVRSGDTIEFTPGSMSITVDGPFRDALLRTLTEPAEYVIDEEPSLEDA